MNIPFDSYETVIGLECHIQLNTKSKLFSKAPNQYGQPANTMVDIVDAGLPGVLPSINRVAVEHALKLGLALSCQIRQKSTFARKHYFYPDLPKGYQITQHNEPLCENGILTYYVDGIEKKLRIERIHMEEDAGKNIHLGEGNASYIDYNRAGTPLLEVVTRPDLRSPKEAMAAFKALRQLATFLGISDGNMQEGSLRADVNVSVRKLGTKTLGTRTETKNLNSFRFLGQAISYEARRQIMELEGSRSITQETRLWDPNLKESRAMRSKEEAHDYRYFPDPDLLPLLIETPLLEKTKNNMEELPHKKYQRYQKDFGLNAYDAEILTSSKETALYFEKAIREHGNPKNIANWIINEVMRSQKDEQNTPEGEKGIVSKVDPTNLGKLVKLIENKTISSSIGKKVFAIMARHPDKEPSKIIEENKWKVISSAEDIQSYVEQTLSAHPNEVKKFLDGKTKVFGFLMGQLMKLSKGKADPKTANDALVKALKEKKDT